MADIHVQDGDTLSYALASTLGARHPPRVRALIPCGGRGTRMAAVTRGIPKEMLPIGGRPAIDWVLRECADSGIDDVLIVAALGKEMLTEHVHALAGTDHVPRRITSVLQMAPRGLADAVRLGHDFAAGEPLAVALPDNLFLTGPRPALGQIIDAHARSLTHVVAVVEIHADEAARRGPTAILDGTPEGAEYHIRRIPNKGVTGSTFDLAGQSSAYTAVGRYVFRPDVFDAITAVEHGLAAGAELDDVPVMQRLLAQGALGAHIIRGRFLDVGLPDGYDEADALLSQHPRFA